MPLGPDPFQAYPTPCSYWALDRPSMTVPTGWTVDIDVTFKGEIHNICRPGGVVAGPNQWKWQKAGVV